jgi:acetyl esterase
MSTFSNSVPAKCSRSTVAFFVAVTAVSAAFAQGRRAGARPEQDPRAGKPLPTFANVHYGKHERQVLDFWKAESERPTPVVVYIHGGGFVGGNKRSIQPVVINTCLESGISVAAIHYRFVTTHPFPAPQMDGARAIQFLRYKAKEWNIDSKHIAAYGGSAGAGISMFLGYHDDLADPNSDDPVARQSSRIVAVGSFGGQTSYDPRVIKQWIGGRAYEHPSIFKCYNIKSVDEIDKPELQPIYDQVSAIRHVSENDPPIIMFYGEPDRDLPPDAKPGQGIHHPRFAHHLAKALDKVGIKYIYHHSSEFKGNPHLEMAKFFRSRFGM